MSEDKRFTPATLHPPSLPPSLDLDGSSGGSASCKIKVVEAGAPKARGGEKVQRREVVEEEEEEEEEEGAREEEGGREGRRE